MKKQIEFFDKAPEPMRVRKVSRAYLITGGTENTRYLKCRELRRGENALMSGKYEGEDELAVIFSAYHSDFHGMTFEEAKKLARSQELCPEFQTQSSPFGREARFGVIDVTSIGNILESKSRFW